MEDGGAAKEAETWHYTNLDTLMKDIEAVVEAEKGGMMVISALLLCIALLAIFDTRVLSVFRRQRDRRLYCPWHDRSRVIKAVFTIEGTIHALLAILPTVLTMGYTVIGVG